MCSASVLGTNRYEYFKNVGGLSHAPTSFRAGIKMASSLSRYARNVQRLPQVMFKAVKSGYCSGFIGLSAQLNYVLGKADRVIDPSGEFDGQECVKQADSQSLASRWADSWKKTTQDGKQTMHLVASFPHGTGEGAVECIIRDTCEELLSQGRNRFDYIAAIHTDTNNPHGHIIVNRRNGEGEWFYLARDHVFNYDLFKDTLVKHAQTYGVELNNSSRLSRGLGDYALDSNPKAAMKGIDGAILDYGSAAYKHQEKGSDSFYVALQTRFGERTIWGVGLSSVLEESGAQRGDTIRIRHEGNKPVEVQTRDGERITTYRNDWRIDFAGEEYGAFAKAEYEVAPIPTDNEQNAADNRRNLILHEAGRYRRFADLCKGAHIALGVALTAASDALRNGYSVEDLSQFKEAMMSEDSNFNDADIARDSDSLFSSIEQAREQLYAVWEYLPNIPDSERPAVEERYFNAVGNMDRLLMGERRREFVDAAQGSIYCDEHRHKLVNKMPACSFQRLEQYGISRDEFTARSNIEACSYALESHWIERDAYDIAAQLNLDMDNEAGRNAAYRLVVDLHSDLIQGMDEAETLVREVGDVETHYNDDPAQAKILHEIRDLAKKDTLSFDKSKWLVEGLNEILGKNGMDEIHRVNPEVFRDVGFDIGSREALRITSAYSSAMKQLGYDTQALNQAVTTKTELLDARTELAMLQEEREIGEKAIEEELNERDSYGL